MITSPANPQIKQVRKLRDRKERQKSGLFYIEGLRIVGEAVLSGWDIEVILFAPELLTSLFGQQTIQNYIDRGGHTLEVSAAVFKSLSEKDGPQGIAALVRQRWADLSGLTLKEGDIWIALDSVADPGNLGTILRTSDACGGKGVILLDQSTDPFDPTCVRASMGAIFNQTIIRSTFPDFLNWKKSQQVHVVGASDKAEQDYYGWKYPDQMVLFMGSERRGLQEHHAALCDAMVAIPMAGKSDSLNLAVATALIAYEFFNQRRTAKKRAVI